MVQTDLISFSLRLFPSGSGVRKAIAKKKRAKNRKKGIGKINCTSDADGQYGPGAGPTRNERRTYAERIV